MKQIFSSSVRGFAIALFLAVLSPCAGQVPQVGIVGDFGDEYSSGILTITDENGRGSSHTVMAKWHGASAKRFQKKSYTFKILDEEGESLDTTLLGMREDNKWILDAMAVDRARMRNRVSFDLWNDFATDTYVKSIYEPMSMNGVRGRFVELTLNGSYEGIYCLMEVMDRKQLRLKKTKGNGTVRGVLYKAEGWYGTSFRRCEAYDNTSPTWMDWETKYPDVEGGDTTSYAPLYDAIQLVLNADAEQFRQEVAECFDLPVWLDYFLFTKLIYAIDNTGKNTFAYVYDITKGKELGIAPWDLDATWGRSYDATELSADTVEYVSNFEWRLIEDYPNYRALLADRYFELRKIYFDADSLKDRFRAYFDYFKSNGMNVREAERWNGIDGIEVDFDAEENYICQWIDDRLAVLDRHFAKYATDIKGIAHDNAAKKSGIYDLQGRRIQGIPVKGIYIRDGRKFLAR